MGFFDDLSMKMGNQAYNSFMNLLSVYLGPYGCMLWMTCRRMRDTFQPQRNFFPVWSFVHYGDWELIKFVYEHEWYIMDHFTPQSVQVAEWMIDRGLLDTQRLFHDACKKDNREMIDFCISRRYNTGMYLWYCDSKSTLDYLYCEKRLPTNENMWVRGGYLSDEWKYLWALQYQHDPNISFKPLFHDLHAICQVLSWWSRCRTRFTNVYVMRRILMCYLEDHIIPLATCRELSNEVARALPSDACECDDPNNHEALLKKARKT